MMAIPERVMMPQSSHTALAKYRLSQEFGDRNFDLVTDKNVFT